MCQFTHKPGEYAPNYAQVKAVLYVNDKGKINNGKYQEINGVSKATATRDLRELVENYKLLERSGEVGVGTNYVLIGS